MALQAQSALLDELMGKNRNAVDKNAQETHWSDDDICKYYIVGLCPHTLFVNTKADLGVCSKIHDDKLASKYQKSSRYAKMGYEQDLNRLLGKLIDDIERRIRRGNERLKNNGPTLNGVFHEEKVKKLERITNKMNELIEEAEKVASDGDFAKSKELLQQADELKVDQIHFQKEVDSYNQSAKELEVCSICGAFRIKDDVPSRTEEHLLGKMHIGYSEVRNFAEKLKDIISGKFKEPNHDKDRPKKDKKSSVREFEINWSRSVSRHRRKKDYNDKEKSNKNKKSHKRSRSRSRKKHKKRSKSHDKRRSYSNHKRSRR